MGTPSQNAKKIDDKSVDEGEIKVKNALKIMLESQKGETLKSNTPRTGVCLGGS